MCKDSARRAKNRANRAKNKVYFNFSEVQPVLSKKKGTCSFSFSEPQPILSKDSARRAKNRANRAKNEVYFNFSEMQPVLSNNKISLLNFVFPSRSRSYLTLEISGRSRISPNAIIPCVQAPPHHRPLRRVLAATPLSLACRDGAATCMPPTNLRSNDCRARHSPGYSTAANWANP